MELVKNIFFNTDKLIENTTIKISYTGTFFENNAEKVFIHYGFGENWEDVSEKEMIKTELGFQAEIELPEKDCLKFCFKNDSGEWDNNDNLDYSFPIEKSQVALVALDSTSEVNFSRRLRKSYIWSKKIKLAIYKIINYIPKLISGNYKKKISDDEQ